MKGDKIEKSVGTTYWKKTGAINTSNTLEIALKAAENEKIRNIVLASNSGETAKKLSKKVRDEGGFDRNIVCVTHHVGFRNPGKDEMSNERRNELETEGIKLLTTTHVLAGVARSIKNDFGGLYPAEIMAYTLRMLGEGVKVAVEISIMALDAGLIPYDEDIVAIGGTGSGADTACIIKPGHSNKVFETKIKEILCRPEN